MYKIAILSSTRGTNFQSIIDAQKNGDLENVEICCLISNKLECGAVDKALASGIPAFSVDAKGKTREEFDQEVSKILDRFEVDLIVLGGYMRILSAEFVQKYPHRIINIHPSLLPKYPGMDLNVHQAVLDAGETETGMTIHYVDEEVDHGEIILQKTVKINSGDHAEDLKAKVQELEKKWYPEVIKKLAQTVDL